MTPIVFPLVFLFSPEFRHYNNEIRKTRNLLSVHQLCCFSLAFFGVFFYSYGLILEYTHIIRYSRRHQPSTNDLQQQQQQQLQHECQNTVRVSYSSYRCP